MPDGDKIFRDAEIQKLLNIMNDLDSNVRSILLKAISVKLNGTLKNKTIRQIKSIIQTSDKDIKEWLSRAVSESYVDGLNDVDKQLKIKGKVITVEMLRTLKKLSVHADAVNALLGDSYLDFANAMNGIVRGAEKKINEAMKLQIRAKIASNILTGSDIRNTKRDIMNILGDKGFTVLVDRGGKQWTLKRYSEMLARTHTIRAFNESAINRANEFGVDIIQISSHGGSCPICVPYEGKIYSLSGKSKQYPRYDIGMPIHPNCKHTILMRPDLQDRNIEE